MTFNQIKMMKNILASCLFLFAFQAMSQQLYYSQYQLTPMLNNPSLIALTEELKVDVGYRNQFGGKGANYSTPMVAAQMPFYNENVKNVFDKIGAGGIQVYTDRTGFSGMLATTGFSATYAHLVNLSTKDRLAFGLQPGVYQRRVDFSKLQSGSQWDGYNGAYNEGFDLKENVTSTERRTFFTLNGGITYIRYNAGGDPFLTLSLGANNLTRPNISLNSGSFKNPMHWNVQGTINAFEDHQFIIKPSVRHIQVMSQSQTNIGSYFYYKLPEAKGFMGKGTIGLGAWYSNKNAVVMALEINQKDWAIGFSYDFLTSSLADAKNSTGAPEIIVGFRKYLGKKQKGYDDKGGAGPGGTGGGGGSGGGKSDVKDPKKAQPTDNNEINKEPEAKPVDPKTGEEDKPAVERQDVEKKVEVPSIVEPRTKTPEAKPKKSTKAKSGKGKKPGAKPAAKKSTGGKKNLKSNLSPELTEKLSKVTTSDEYLGKDPYAGTAKALNEEQMNTLKKQPRFGFSGVELDERAQDQLAKIAAIMKDRPKMKLEIGGFGCDLGGPEVTKIVAMGRAEAVRRFLASKGVPAKQIQTRSYGMENPQTDNATDLDKITNRRVQFKFIQ